MLWVTGWEIVTDCGRPFAEVRMEPDEREVERYRR